MQAEPLGAVCSRIGKAWDVPNSKRNGAAALDSQGAAKQSQRWLFLRRDPEFLDPLRRLYDPPNRLIDPFVTKGQTVVDLGCGSGYFTFPIADRVGPEGKVFAVDLDEGCIRHVRAIAERLGYRNVEAHASSAADLGFIPDGSIGFLFANGLLCSMHDGRPQAVGEIKRVLGPTGLAFLSLGMPPPFGLVGEAEWMQIMEGFAVRQGGSFKQRWAVVSLGKGKG
jgi:SAM-dependent methyltransferase